MPFQTSTTTPQPPSGTAESNAPSKARIYALASPQIIKQEERSIRQILFEAFSDAENRRFRTERVLNPANHLVTVAQSSGWIEYVATDKLWASGQPPKLPNATDASNCVKALLSSLQSRFAPGNGELPRALQTLLMVPPVRPPGELVLAPRPDEQVWDHWLCRTQVQLSLGRDDGRQVTVFGAGIDVRIGDRGQVVYYQARWRPVSLPDNLATNPDIVPLGATGSDASGAQGKNSKPPPNEIIYLLDGDGIPQYYLSPYYLINDGDTLGLESACAYSLTVMITRDQTKEGMKLTANVRGGSGNYAFRWAMYSLELVLDQGFLELPGDQSTVVIKDPGAYVILLNVKDKETGAFRHHQQQIHSVPDLPQPGNIA